MNGIDNIRYTFLAGRQIAVLDRAEICNLYVSRAIANIKTTEGADEPFLVYNLNTLVQRYALWKAKLPRVHLGYHLINKQITFQISFKPYYAVKCNDDPVLVSVLAALGAGFDCASKREIDQIVEQGVEASERILYANPCKTRSFIKHASRVNVRMMTFDSAEELLKVKTEHDDPRMILRIAIGDPFAQCPLSVKFGCEPPLEEGSKLLRLAAKLNVLIIGISFHVGSGCKTPNVFREAICIAKALFDYGNELGHSMHLLDIGGGFPGDDTAQNSFDKIVDVILPCLDELFPAESGVKIIAEPGRFFAAPVVSETVNVVARKRVPASRITKITNDQREGFMYYINDGVYGSFNCILFDHAQPKGLPLYELTDENMERHPTTIWGPTCDGLDQVEPFSYSDVFCFNEEYFQLSTEMRELQTGEWLYYPCMGAYTTVATTTFNGFEKPEIYYVVDLITWETLFPPSTPLYGGLCSSILSSSDNTSNEPVASTTAAVSIDIRRATA